MLPIDFLLLPHSLLFFVQEKISHVLSQVLALFLQQFPLFMILDQWKEWHQIHEFVFAQQNPLCYNVGQWKNAWSLFAHLWSLNFRTRVYPDMRFTEDIFSFKQLPTKEKWLFAQFTKIGKCSFLNLEVIQNVYMLRGCAVPIVKGAGPLKICRLCKKWQGRGI